MGKNYDKNQSKKSCDTLPLKKGVCHENCDPIFKCGFGSPRYSQLGVNHEKIDVENLMTHSL